MMTYLSISTKHGISIAELRELHWRGQLPRPKRYVMNDPQWDDETIEEWIKSRKGVVS